MADRGDVLSHSLALIEGEIILPGKSVQPEGSVEISDEKSCNFWPVVKGRFKALKDLSLGPNRFWIKYEGYENEFNLTYSPVRSDYFVRLLYLVCSDDKFKGRFQGPPVLEDQYGSGEEEQRYSSSDGCRRIIFGAKLIQLFTAECLHRTGLKRRTFRLETDSGGQPVCHVFKLNGITTDEAYKLDDHELWKATKDELAKDKTGLAKKAEFCKYVAFISFTRYSYDYSARDKLVPETHQEILTHVKAHAALGGGGLALLGTGCLHTWASDISEIVPCFSCHAEIDRTLLLDDSSYRKTYWACYATTLGAFCHELGHTFGLCHNKDGIMARGFDNINRVFVLEDCSKDVVNPAEHYHQGLTSNVLADQELRSNVTIKELPQCNDLICGSLQRAVIGTAKDHQATLALQSKTVPLRFCSKGSFVHQFQLNKQMLVDWKGAYWTRAEAIWLFYHKWFFSDSNCERNSYQGPTRKKSSLEIRAHHGLRIVLLAADVDGDKCLINHWEFLNGGGPLTFRIPEEAIKNQHNVVVMAEDSYGNILVDNVAKIY